ncbi:AtpZ/AtpI family protein [Bombella saccharophila]|uniref:ATP synthase protein I n=1 Tax=Bombella saccharophila TaxID=2967338 RepID=A0ABT3W6H8_9PROT|nr:AtpZ/AtpI family protein [Bombella saccharophila]MCX5614476.1 AtpZ/AtpI family protein [Bombella saccharophila]
MSHHDTTKASQFDERLAHMEQKLTPKNTPKKTAALSEDSALGMAFRIASDLIAGVVVGLGIGYELDQWTGRKPVFMIVFTMLGMAAGFRNVWRIVNVSDVPATGAHKNGRDQRGQRIED